MPAPTAGPVLKRGMIIMSTAYLTDYAGYLTTALTEYAEIVGRVTKDISKIIMTFGSIVQHTDSLLLSDPELPGRQVSWAGVEVRRLALDTMGQATTIRDSMQEVHQETRGGLSRVEEMMRTVKEESILSAAEQEYFVQQVSEVGEVLQQIRAKADDLIPAALDILELARVLQDKVEMLVGSLGSGQREQTLNRSNADWRDFAPAFTPEAESGGNRELHRLISLTHHRFREN